MAYWASHFFMFPSERNHWDEAYSKPWPSLDAVRRPVAAIMALCCHSFVAWQGAAELVRTKSYAESHVGKGLRSTMSVVARAGTSRDRERGGDVVIEFRYAAAVLRIGGKDDQRQGMAKEERLVV